MSGESIKVYIITHKVTDVPEEPGYYPLMVGAARHEHLELPQTYLRDDEGDNISLKNNSYCEMTGLYWIWKHSTADIVGLVHYRRFFADIRALTFRGKRVVLKKKGSWNLLSENEIREKLQKADVIVKMSKTSRNNMEKVFRNTIPDELFDNITRVIQTKYPEYLDTYQTILRAHQHFNCNMFIGRKKVMAPYFEWIFAILQELDEMHRASTGEYYSSRELGYVGELLFEVWIRKNKVSYVMADVVNPQDPYDENGLMNVGEFITFYSKVLVKKIRK